MLSIAVNDQVNNRGKFIENLAYHLKRNSLSDSMKVWYSSGVCCAYDADGKAHGKWEEEKPDTAIDADLLLNGYYDTMVNLYGDEALLFYNDADEFSGFMIRLDDCTKNGAFLSFHPCNDSDADLIDKRLRKSGFIY